MSKNAALSKLLTAGHRLQLGPRQWTQATSQSGEHWQEVMGSANSTSKKVLSF